jgi:hypothetical protein
VRQISVPKESVSKGKALLLSLSLKRKKSPPRRAKTPLRLDVVVARLASIELKLVTKVRGAL